MQFLEGRNKEARRGRIAAGFLINGRSAWEENCRLSVCFFAREEMSKSTSIEYRQGAPVVNPNMLRCGIESGQHGKDMRRRTILFMMFRVASFRGPLRTARPPPLHLIPQETLALSRSFTCLLPFLRSQNWFSDWIKRRHLACYYGVKPSSLGPGRVSASPTLACLR